MTPDALRALLGELVAGDIGVDDAVAHLSRLPYESVEGATIDHHRELRQGAPEVIYGGGKTPEQITRIAEVMLERGSNVLCTRTSPEAAEAVRQSASIRSATGDAPGVAYDAAARVLSVIRRRPEPLGTLGVVCAGTSDLPVAREAVLTAEFLGIETHLLTDVGVAGLHRLLDKLEMLRRLDVVIVVAGMEGALPSVVGGLIAAPLVAVPTSVGYGAALGGLAALFGMLSSCAAGVTVVNIDNGFGAAMAAARILRRR